jgi:hypothetical protein
MKRYFRIRFLWLFETILNLGRRLAVKERQNFNTLHLLVPLKRKHSLQFISNLLRDLFNLSSEDSGVLGCDALQFDR